MKSIQTKVRIIIETHFEFDFDFELMD